MSNPFHIAEEYIQLRKKLYPTNWVDVIMRMNELIITPFVSIFLYLMGESDTLTICMTALSTFRNWKQWILFTTRRFEMQDMLLQTMKSGGPKIRTNNPDYLPYVYADAVMRLMPYALHRDPAQDHPPLTHMARKKLDPETHSQ